MNGPRLLSLTAARRLLDLRRVGNSPAGELPAPGRRVRRGMLVALGLLTALLFAIPGVVAAESPTPDGSLSGMAFVDSNGNGRRDRDEVHGIANLPVSVIDDSGSWVVITPTAADGRYAVTDLPAGTYTVTALLDPAMGLIPTSPTSHRAFLTETGTLRDLDFGFLLTNAVYFIDASAIRRSDGVHVAWSTSLEIGNDGFVIYRAASPAGPFERLNAQLIPAAAISGGGAEYEFIDETAAAGASYYYAVEAEPGLQHFGPWPTISFRYLPFIRRLLPARSNGISPS